MFYTGFEEPQGLARLVLVIGWLLILALMWAAAFVFYTGGISELAFWLLYVLPYVVWAIATVAACRRQ